MKTVSLLLAISICLFSFGCKKLNIEKELRIDIGSDFQSDFVTVKLDDDVVFSDIVTTNPLLGFAEVLVFDYPIGKYEISVNVNGIEETDKFTHKSSRFVFIYYDRNSSAINIKYPDEPYLYD